jgi:predicted AlkP superfamily pyrophosphatase or phosphodiesterase
MVALGSRVVTCAVLVSFLVMAPIASQEAARADHVVLISVDGMLPAHYLDSAWPAPMIQLMAREGAHAKAMRSVFPSVTYPAHTTIITGALPIRHGVHYNSPFEPGGQTGRWYWDENEILLPTLWDAVVNAGRRSASLSWPVTVGAPIEWNIPEIWSIETGVDFLEVMKRTTTPADLFDEIEREATGRLTLDNFNNSALIRDDRIGAIAAYLLETKKPALLAVHVLGVDHFQHEAGLEAEIVKRSLTCADNAVRQIVDAAERAGILERTTFLVFGDHGFVPIHTILAPNVWLTEAGLMEANRDRGDWRATLHTTAASAFLHLRDPEDHEAAAQARRVLENQPRNIRKLYRIVDRDGLDEIGAAPEAAFALALMPGVSVTASPNGPAVRAGEGATHGFWPLLPELHAGFIAWGSGIREGAVAQILGLEDIAPLAAELLGIEFQAPDGVTPAGLLSQPRRRN